MLADQFGGAAEEFGVILQRLLNHRQIKSACDVVQPKNADQHQDRAGHGVKDKFYSRVNAALMAPDADQESHGDKHDFPKQEEEEQVQREKDADNTDFQ